MHRKRLCGLFLASLLLWPAFVHSKGLTPAALPGENLIEQFLGNHSTNNLAIIQDWVGLDVSYREADGGLSGQWTEVTDIRVQDPTELESISTVYVSDGPRFQLKDVEVKVLTDGDVRRFRRKDLRWIEMTSRSDGVVTLDGTDSFALIPGIRVGDRVRIKRRYSLKGLSGLPRVVLGSPNRPYLQTGFEIRLPKDYILAWEAQGSEASRERLIHVEQMQGGKIVHRWRLAADKDGTLPVCRERFPRVRITPHVQHAGKNHVDDISCGQDWQQVGDAYLRQIDGLFEATDEMRRHVAEITEGVEDPIEKIDRIYASVQKRCRYLGLFEGTGNIIPVPAKEVFSLGFGDCKGLGTLLISLLRAAGIPSHPVLVLASTSRRLSPNIPNMAQFNHYIAWADDGEGGVFLDGTVDFCPAGLVPSRDAASPVLLLKPGAVGLVEIPGKSWDPGEGRQIIKGHLGADGLLRLNLAYSVSGNLGVRWRGHLSSLGKRDRRKVILETLLPDGLALKNGEPVVEGMKDRRGPLEMKVSATCKRPLPADGETVFLPRALALTDWRFDPDVGCEAQLDLRRRSRSFLSWSIELPEGMVLAEPDSLSLGAEGLELTHRVWQEGRTLKLEREFRFNQDFATDDQVETMRKVMAEAAQWKAGYFELRKGAR